MLKEALAIIAMTIIASSYSALADDEKPITAATIPDLKSGRSRRKLPTNYCIKHLYVLAHTSSYLYAGSIGDHKIVLKANGQLRTIILPRPSGGLVQNKGDLWKLSLEKDFGFIDCITVKQIENIALIENHNDGWNIDSIVTFLVVNPYYWALSSADFDVNRWVDKDGDPSYKQFILTLCV